MANRSREKCLNDLEAALGSTADRDTEEYPIPESWVPLVPPWLRNDHDDAFMFMLKAGHGEFDSSRADEWCEEHAPEDVPQTPKAHEAMGDGGTWNDADLS